MSEIEADKKERENVVEQWVHCHFGTDSKWNRMYLVLNEKGTLSLFSGETMETVKGSFDSTLWTENDFVETKEETEFGAFKLAVKRTEEHIAFGFETEEQRQGLMTALRLFIAVDFGQNEEDPNGMNHIEPQSNCKGSDRHLAA